jgi:hypothetical protein
LRKYFLQNLLFREKAGKFDVTGGEVNTYRYVIYAGKIKRCFFCERFFAAGEEGGGV